MLLQQCCNSEWSTLAAIWRAACALSLYISAGARCVRRAQNSEDGNNSATHKTHQTISVFVHLTDCLPPHLIDFGHLDAVRLCRYEVFEFLLGNEAIVVTLRTHTHALLLPMLCSAAHASLAMERESTEESKPVSAQQGSNPHQLQRCSPA